MSLRGEELKELTDKFIEAIKRQKKVIGAAKKERKV